MADAAYEAISKAKRQVEGGNVKGAVETLESYLETDPHNVKPRLQLANIAYYNLKDTNYGDMQMNVVLDLEPDNVDALKASVTVLLKDKKNNKLTDERFVKLLKLSPSAELYGMYAVFLKMQMLDFPKAAEYYEMAIALNPNKYEYHQNYAVLLLNDFRDYEKAKHELEEVMRLKPGDAKIKKNYDMLLKKKFDKNGNLKKSKIPFKK